MSAPNRSTLHVHHETGISSARLAEPTLQQLRQNSYHVKETRTTSRSKTVFHISDLPDWSSLTSNNYDSTLITKKRHVPRVVSKTVFHISDRQIR